MVAGTDSHRHHPSPCTYPYVAGLLAAGVSSLERLGDIARFCDARRAGLALRSFAIALHGGSVAV